MHNGSLHRNDQIERAHERGCLIIVVDRLLPMVDAHAVSTFQIGQFRLAFRVLQADEADIPAPQYGQPLVERDRPCRSPSLIHPAAPGDPDLAPPRKRRESPAPRRNPLRMRSQITVVDWKGFKRAAKVLRQAADSNLTIHRRYPL